MSELELWEKDGNDNGWQMPYAPRWKRLPVIRHLRCIWLRIQIERHYAMLGGMFGFRTGYDDWIAYGIWHGKESPSP